MALISHNSFIALCLEISSDKILHSNDTNLEAIDCLITQLNYLHRTLSSTVFGNLEVRLRHDTVRMPIYMQGCDKLRALIATQCPTPKRNAEVRRAVSIAFLQIAHQLY